MVFNTAQAFTIRLVGPDIDERDQMRWESLFDDLEGSFLAEQQRDLDAEVADRVRRERGQLGLHERLAAARGSAITLQVGERTQLAGTVGDVGSGWLLLVDERRREALIPFEALTWIAGLTRESRTTSIVTRSFTLVSALRAVARDRAVVTVLTRYGIELAGTIDAVGADAIDLAEHPIDQPRRAAAVISTRVLPLSALAAVRRV